MELNPKLLQFSLDVKLTQSKIIQTNHYFHLKKLHQIKHQPIPLRIKQKTQSLKFITDSIHKYHQLSKTFQSKLIQQKRCSQDLKMIRSLSQIHHHRLKQQKTQQQSNINLQRYKERNQNHKKLINILKTKQLQERNLKIAMRISKQQNDFSYVQKIKNQIKEYAKIRKNLQKIKNQPIILSRNKRTNKKKQKLAIQSCQLVLREEKQRTQSNMKLKTQQVQQDSDQQFLYEVLKKHPSQILNQRFFKNMNTNQIKQNVLPKLV